MTTAVDAPVVSVRLVTLALSFSLLNGSPPRLIVSLVEAEQEGAADLLVVQVACEAPADQVAARPPAVLGMTTYRSVVRFRAHNA